MSTTKIVNQTLIYSGYNRYAAFDLKIPNLKKENQPILLNNREILETKDVVHVLIYAKEIDSFVFCQQFRCGAFIGNQSEDPFLIECIAGAIESGLSPEETAIKEVKEESNLTVDNLHFLFSGFSSPGVMTEKAYFYYATVVETPTPTIAGIACENEQILTHVIKRQDVYQMMDKNQFADCKTLLALNWYRCFDKDTV
ncbi:NUDIX domain-containing protein [Legionella sp. W05-934-2]|jgi:ADP-ribose pyrophosphatase|uniref:NUDIX domain-containing protein n=1 Tax=Legionella sp. W05-934-2 TaxID=1198649 RepID=UPI00346301C9